MLEKIFSTAFILTVAFCLAVEALVMAVAYSHFNNFLESAFYSLIVLGPVSLWFGPSLYRYMLRATEP
jgi:hypothetical protein